MCDHRTMISPAVVDLFISFLQKHSCISSHCITHFFVVRPSSLKLGSLISRSCLFLALNSLFISWYLWLQWFPDPILWVLVSLLIQFSGPVHKQVGLFHVLPGQIHYFWPSSFLTICSLLASPVLCNPALFLLSSPVFCQPAMFFASQPCFLVGQSNSWVVISLLFKTDSLGTQPSSLEKLSNKKCTGENNQQKHWIQYQTNITSIR